MPTESYFVLLQLDWSRQTRPAVTDFLQVYRIRSETVHIR